ncbi:Omega-ctenitoxin-Cs1a, partial [Cymbomonas tetramitiformis]
ASAQCVTGTQAQCFQLQCCVARYFSSMLRDQATRSAGASTQCVTRSTRSAGASSSRMLRDQVESNICRCPDQDAAERMIKAIDDVRTKGDSCGGVVTCVARGVPKGLGAPVFAKLEAELAQAMMSIPATKGFEIGSGFDGAEMTGSTHNDEFYLDDSGAVRTRTNRSGGIQGGISNGETIVIRVAFKPTSTISINQKTVTRGGEETDLRARGRHDPCVVPRAVPMVESMVALVLVDHLLQQHAQCHLFGGNFGGDLSLVAPTISADEAGSSGESKEDLSLAQQAAAYSED